MNIHEYLCVMLNLLTIIDIAKWKTEEENLFIILTCDTAIYLQTLIHKKITQPNGPISY